MNRLMKGVFGAALLASATSQALADPGIVEISGMSGKVLADLGNGYIPVPDPTTLPVGAKVLVGQDGHAYVTYLDTGCRIDLPPGSVATITLPDPCEAAALAPQESSVSFSRSLPWIAIGGIAAAAIVTVVVVSSDNNDGGGDGDGSGGPVSKR